MRKRTRLSVIGLAIVAIMATMAVAAQGASAFTWTNAGKVFANGETQALKSAGAYDKFGEEAVARLTFTATISGTPIRITSAAIETSGAVIKQNGTEAQVTGKFVFKSLTLDEPLGCSPPASVTTTQLVGKSFEKSGATYLELKPASGTPFATITLTGTCAFAGTPFKVTTSNYVCGRTNPVGTMAVAQKLEVSQAILTACGGTLSALGNAATLQGNATYELASGESWGAK